MTNPPFLPIGLPRDASTQDALEQRVGLHLLEALESLDAVYKSAVYFADASAHASLADYTLARCAEAARGEAAALWFVEADGLRLHADRGGAAALLAEQALARADVLARACLHNGDDARMLLRPGAPPRNALTCPVLAGDRALALIVVLGPASTPFSSGDTKLVAAVASQAAIALSRAQQHREAELERQKLRLVVQNHHDGIVVLDADGRTTLCNAIARELLGGDDVLAALRTIDPQLTLAALIAGPTARELVRSDGDQQRVLGVEVRALRDESGAVGNVVVTCRDLTRQRRDERLNRNFVSLLSHKLRTPLTSLQCALQLLEGAPSAEHPALLAEMNLRMHDLGLLIDRLFDFTDLIDGDRHKRGSGSLEAARTEVAAHLAWRPDAVGARIVWELAPDACEVPVPTNRLRIVLLNLIDNAIKFTGEERPWVRVAARRTPHSICIDVEDRGPGIPKADQASVLEAFRQLDADFTGNVPGAGLGIAMVREIARRAGGSLRLADAEPRGCIFTVELPLAPPGGRA